MEHRNESEASDTYRRVTAQIIEAIKKGAGEFVMPWHNRGSSGFPLNASTRRPYHGVNVLALWAAGSTRSYTSPFWGTYRQWSLLDARVKKGEHGVLVVFYKDLWAERKKEQDVPETPRFVLRSTVVFNAEQVDGWSQSENEAEDRTARLAEADSFISALGANVQYLGDRAFYNKVHDFIRMPERNQFVGTKTSSPTEAFYATLLHEHIHWSGHRDRLDRDLSGRFGSHAYAMEELVAELGAAFLCADLGISAEPRVDHAAYVSSWLRVLQERSRAVFMAASAATTACKYLADAVAESRSATAASLA